VRGSREHTAGVDGEGVEPDITPHNADQLDRVLASQRRALENVASDEQDVNSEAVGHLMAYASLLRAVIPAPAIAEPSPDAERHGPHRYMFMLEFPDGRWDVAERQLETIPRAGDEVSFDDGKLWRVRETRLVRPAPARKPPRQMFVCATAG
jgi:hypothetical protein